MGYHKEMATLGFLLGYPCFLIGRYSVAQVQADPDLRQQWATTEVTNQRALMVFTEELFAERVMLAEAFPGDILTIESHKELTDLIRRNRIHFSIVLIDPNPRTLIGRSFSVDEFLLEFEADG